MPHYVGSRDWLDTMNRLWWLDSGGTLPPARVDPAPTERASPLGAPVARIAPTRPAKEIRQTFLVYPAPIESDMPCGGVHEITADCLACRHEGGTL